MCEKSLINPPTPPTTDGEGSDAATCYASLLQDVAIAFAQAEHMEGLGEIGADEVSSAVAELLHEAHAYSEHNVKLNRPLPNPNE